MQYNGMYMLSCANLCKTGCVYTPITCDDSDLCTANSCNVTGGCVYTNIVCNDNNACTTDSCSKQVEKLRYLFDIIRVVVCFKLSLVMTTTYVQLIHAIH